MRRSTGTVLAAAVVAAAVAGPAGAGPVGAPAPTAAVDWPQYRANGAHTGAVAAQPGLDPASVARRGLRLAASTTPLTFGDLGAAPSTAGQRAFLTGDDLLAVNIANGHSAWLETSQSSDNSQAAVSHGVVTAAIGGPAPVGGFDAATGAVRWELPVIGEADGPPVVNAAGDTGYFFNAYGGSLTLQSFDVQTGAAGWTAPAPPGVEKRGAADGRGRPGVP